MIVNRNIDLVQINLQENQKEYYFPRNVEWLGKKISRIRLYMAADSEENPMLSPVDGITPVVQESQITSDLYINLYDDTDKEIARNAGRIVVLDACRIVMDGTPREVFSRAEELVRIGLGVPEVTRIAMALRKRGVPVDGAVYTQEELRAQLLRLKGGGAPC